MDKKIEELVKQTKLTEPEKAGIYGRFARLKGESKTKIGYSTLGDMIASAQHHKILSHPDLYVLVKGEGIVSRASWYVPLAEALKEKRNANTTR